MLKRMHALTDRGFYRPKSIKLVSAVLLCCLLVLSFLIVSASSVSEVSHISCSGMIEYSAVALFETGFETGDLSEVETEITDPATVNVVSGNPHTGTYSAKIYTGPPGGPYGRGRIYKNVNDLTEIYVRAFFYVDYWDGYIQCIRMAGHYNDYYVYIGTVIISSNYIRLGMGMSGKNPGDWMPNPKPSFPYGVGYGLETDRWYCLELGFKKSTSGFFKVWLDGQQIITYEGNTNTLTAPGVDRALVGVVLYQTDVSPATIYVDDFVVDDGYIGP